MGRIQPTDDSNNSNNEASADEVTVTEQQEATNDDEQAQDDVTTEEQDTNEEPGEESSDSKDEPTAQDRIAAVHSVLTQAASETDPTTGTVPLAQLAAIATAVRTVRGNARVEAVSTWSVEAFTGGELEPIAIGAVIAAANNPTTHKPSAPTMPAHEVLAYRLALLELAADKLTESAGDEVTEQAIELQTSDGFEVPDTVAARADKVAAEASKGTGRRTSSGGHDGPRADLAALLVDALADVEPGEPIPFAEVKTAVVTAGGSAGGALDNRFAALLHATDKDGADMTAATRALFDQGIRATFDKDSGQRHWYKVAE